MDILKVFNMVVCNSKAPSERHGFNFDIFGLLVAPINILFPFTRFAILAYITIFIFFVLIYSSQSSVIKKVTADKKGQPIWWNSLFLAILLYVFQTVVILTFLKYTICDQTMEWGENDYHLTMQQYNDERYNISDGY